MRAVSKIIRRGQEEGGNVTRREGGDPARAITDAGSTRSITISENTKKIKEIIKRDAGRVLARRKARQRVICA
jgi:hypothetical protein